MVVAGHKIVREVKGLLALVLLVVRVVHLVMCSRAIC
jgi:hypothetical protein